MSKYIEVMRCMECRTAIDRRHRYGVGCPNCGYQDNQYGWNFTHMEEKPWKPSWLDRIGFWLIEFSKG